MPRRISSVRRTRSFAAARRRAIACSATEILYAPALLHTMADGGNRSNGKWSAPATSDWIIRTAPAFCRKSAGNSRGKPIDTTTSAVDHTSSRSSGGRSSRITGSNAPAAAALATADRRSASIRTMNRTRAIGPPDAAAGLGPFDAARSAFRIAAGVALHAAFLEHEGLAALRALGIQALPQQLRGVAGLLLHLDFCLDGGAEHLEQAFLVLVDRDVQGAVPGQDLLRSTGDHVGTGSRPDDGGLGWHLDVNLFRLLRVSDADVEDLVLARSVAVDRDALAVQIVGEQVGLLHVLDGGLAGKVDRLRDRGVAPVLERSLHANVPFRRDVVRGGEHPLPLLRDFL